MRLTGERVTLRDFVEADIPVFSHWQLPGHRWHELDGPYYPKPDANEVAVMADRIQHALEAGSWPEPRMRLVIADSSTDELLGLVTSYWESQETNWLSIGIVVFDEANWGRGIGTEALQHWVSYLFGVRPEIVRLDLRTWSGNTGMMALACKLGFQQEACFRKARIVNGEYFDGLAYGVLRDEWEDRQ